MNKEPLSRKLIFGIFYLLSSSLTTLGINVIIVGFVARSLGVENFGLYSAILSFIGLFQFLSDFGLNKTLLKFGSTDIDKARGSFGNALILKSILVIPTLLLLTLLGYCAGYRNEQIAILEFFAISLVLDSYGTVFSSIRRILGNFKLIAFFRVLRTIINLIITIVAITLNNSVSSLAIANAMLSFIVFIISLINTLLILKPTVQLSLIKEFFKDSIIFSFNDFFLNIYGKISTVLLSFLSDLHSVGIYSAAVRFTRIANLLPNQVKFALLPTMYRMLEEQRTDEQAIDSQSSKKVFTTLLKYMVILATPLVVSIYFFSDFFIHLIFGKKYDLSIPLVQLFSLFIYLRFLEAPFSLFYIGLHKHKNMVYFQGITCVLNIVLNLILIPKYSVYGACYATIFSESVSILMLIVLGRKYLIWGVMDVLIILMKPLIAIFISLLITYFILNKANILIQVLLLLIIYSGFIFLTKTLNTEDITFFKKIFALKKK